MGFEDMNSGKEVRDALQIRGPEFGESWSDGRLKGKFDTMQLFDSKGNINARVPYEDGDRGTKLKPITRYYNGENGKDNYGKGGKAQLINKEPVKLKYDDVVVLPDEK